MFWLTSEASLYYKVKNKAYCHVKTLVKLQLIIR